MSLPTSPCSTPLRFDSSKGIIETGGCCCCKHDICACALACACCNTICLFSPPTSIETLGRKFPFEEPIEEMLNDGLAKGAKLFKRLGEVSGVTLGILGIMPFLVPLFDGLRPGLCESSNLFLRHRSMRGSWRWYSACSCCRAAWSLAFSERLADSIPSLYIHGNPLCSFWWSSAFWTWASSSTLPVEGMLKPSIWPILPPPYCHPGFGLANPFGPIPSRLSSVLSTFPSGAAVESLLSGDPFLTLCPLETATGVTGDEGLCTKIGGDVASREHDTSSSVPLPGLGRSSEGDRSPLEELESSSSPFSASVLLFRITLRSFFDFLMETRKWQSFSLLGLCWFRMILKLVFSLMGSFCCLSSFTVLRQTNTAESWLAGIPVFWLINTWKRLKVNTECTPTTPLSCSCSPS